METPSLSSLECLSDIGLHGRVDMRPTLLRVLTDLYVQNLVHSAEEERHYTELALRLLETVDVPTRVAVATRLARHLAPPARVMQSLAADLPEVAAALHSPIDKPAAPPATAARRSAAGAPGIAGTAVPVAPAAVGPALAGELNELFFAANAEERRLILRNLDIVTAGAAQRPAIACDPALVERLEAAALGRRREDFSRELARLLGIPRRQAQRIARDQSGEPIVVAAKAVSMPRAALYRLLLFVNNAVGHSVERVHALAALYDEITAPAAQDLVAIWQALGADKDERTTVPARPMAADGDGARHQPVAQRGPGRWPGPQRRDAS